MHRSSRPLPARPWPWGLALALLALAAPARAAWPPDPTVNVPLCTTVFSSQVTAAVGDGTGGAIVVWYEDRNGDYDVFARRVRADGTPLWTANGLPLCTTGFAGTQQVLPKAVSDGAGGAIVAWIDGRAGANQLFAQRVDSTGARLWGTGGLVVATNTTAQVVEFCMIPDGAGGAVVVWSTLLSGLSTDIYAQRLNASGVMQWGSGGRLACNTPEDQFRPVVARTGGGAFAVAWEDTRVLFRTQLYGQLYSATGTAQWAANGKLLVNSADNSINPMLVASGAADLLLFWDADSLGVPDIRGQRFDALGNAGWPAAGLRLFPAGVSGLLGVATDQAGGAYAVAAAFDPASGAMPLCVQRVRADGALLFAAKGVRASATSSNQAQVTIAPDNASGLLLAWTDDQRGLAPHLDVFAQRLSGSGAPLWPGGGVPVCRAPSEPSGLALAHNGSGGAVLAWSDTRTSPNPDVYAQGVDAAGQLGAAVGVEGAGPGTVPTSLGRPSPNPAPHGATTIHYTLSRPGRVQLRVVDPSGRVVSVLEEGERGAGTHEVRWDGRARGEKLPPGLYLVQLVTAHRSEIRRLVLL